MALVCLAGLSAPAHAADHADAPEIISDFAADIGDFYAWHSGDRITALITVGPFAVAGQDPFYDENVLLGFHVDTDGDEVANATVWARFGRDAAGNWGVQFTDIPGESGPLEGPVDTVLEGGAGAKAYAGLRDDPFFFDREGLFLTLTTEDVSFSAERDWLWMKNVTAIMVEFPIAPLQAQGPVRMWGTTARR